MVKIKLNYEETLKLEEEGYVIKDGYLIMQDINEGTYLARLIDDAFEIVLSYNGN